MAISGHSWGCIMSKGRNVRTRSQKFWPCFYYPVHSRINHLIFSNGPGITWNGVLLDSTLPPIHPVASAPANFIMWWDQVLGQWRHSTCRFTKKPAPDPGPCLLPAAWRGECLSCDSSSGSAPHQNQPPSVQLGCWYPGFKFTSLSHLQGTRIWLFLKWDWGILILGLDFHASVF